MVSLCRKEEAKSRDRERERENVCACMCVCVGENRHYLFIRQKRHCKRMFWTASYKLYPSKSIIHSVYSLRYNPFLTRYTGRCSNIKHSKANLIPPKLIRLQSILVDIYCTMTFYRFALIPNVYSKTGLFVTPLSAAILSKSLVAI